MIGTGMIAMLASFASVPPIGNIMGTCTLDSIIGSKLYESGIHLTEEQRDIAIPYIEDYRDRVRKDYCGDCIGSNIEKLLKRTKKEGIIKDYKKVMSHKYRFQEKTIVDLQGMVNNTDIKIIRKARRGESVAPNGHTATLVGELDNYWVVFSDSSRGGKTHRGYDLLSKEDWDFYILTY